MHPIDSFLMARLLAVSVFAITAASSVIPAYVADGFRHILPHGPDHILFILGLFFVGRNPAVLLFEMTLFTLAHSLTLGLSIFGFVSLPTAFVEVMIALSITLVALENLWAEDRARLWRPWIVFSCGLIHGLGFAHSFAGHTIAHEDFLTALFSFNVGIECGQLAVIGIAFGVTCLWRNRGWYGKTIARPTCLAIASAGLYLALQRAT